ncbi:MAG: carbohydrate ABC transporter permease [Christensenellales bacterium]|jgi:putative aldouronate transport system permease protein
MAIRKSTGRIVFEICNIIFMLALSVIMLYPFLYVASASVSSNTAILAGRVSIIPDTFDLKAYQAVFKYKLVWTAYGNTLLYTSAGTTINLILTVLGAYPLSRKDFYGKGLFTFMIAFTMLFSGGLIPTFLVVRNLGLFNTRWAILLPGAISTMNMIIMRTFFQGIPDSLEEAATIDGCTDMQVLTKIILPLSTASLMTIGMFYAVGHWNRWFDAMIYLRDNTKYPLQLVLRSIVLQNQINDLLSGQAGTTIEDGTNLIAETIKYAVIMVAVIPILCVYPFVQKYFVKGVMIGSIKG